MKATAVEKRYFPWTSQRFVDTLHTSLKKLKWTDAETSGCLIQAKLQHKVRLGDSDCPLELTVTASWKEIGEGIEVTIAVSEDSNSWSIIECQKKCKALLEFLYAPASSRSVPNDLAIMH